VDFNHVNSVFTSTHLEKINEVSLLVDPPRSGLGHFLSYDFWKQRPFANIVYVSCSLNSWVKDSQKLLSYGYKLKNITLVDQFPRTDHFEIISNWQ
jgi:23S rRNA (uracil1939-C5)-methyltransferase